MVDFTEQVKKAGIPTTAAEIEAKFLEVAEETGNPLNNKDKYSPFWAIIQALCVQPVLWLVRYMIESILPNQYLKTATGFWLELKGWEYEEDKKQAQKARGLITFQRISAGGNQTIAAGAVIHSLPIAGVVYKLQTVDDLIFQNGDTEKTVLCEALEFGENSNLGAGLYVVLPESIAGIARVFNNEDWLIRLGADEELDEDYRLRIRDKFSQLNQFHVDTVYRNMIGQFNGIKTSNVFFDKTAPRGAGSANALILLDHGDVSIAQLAEINNFIRDQGNHGIGDDIEVIGFTKNNVSLNVDIYLDAAASPEEKAETKAGIESFINAAFRKVPSDNFTNKPRLVEPFKRFSFSHLSAMIHKEYPLLLSIDFNHEDIEHALDVSNLLALVVTAYEE